MSTWIIYIYALPFEPPSHLPPITPLWADTAPLLEFPETYSKFPLAIYFTYCKFPCYSFHTSHPLLPSPHVHKSLLYVYFSILMHITFNGCMLFHCIKVLLLLLLSRSVVSPTLCNPMDCSPPGSPIPGIFQARVLEWGAIAFSGIKVQKITNQSPVTGHLDCFQLFIIT